MEAPNEHPSHSRRITGHNGSAAAGAPAAAAPDTDASTPTIQFQTDDGANETDANNTTASSGENPDFEDDQPPEYADDGTPGAAAGLRVTPIDFGEEWMGTETTDSDAEYATTGPFALFSLSAPAENARIAQSAAGAQLLKANKRSASITTTTPRPPTARATTKLSCSSRTARRRRSASRPRRRA